MIEALGRELSVLKKAIAYPNLSGAARHIGLSQPQLSRIIGKLEKELGMRLLDRDAKRKSSWTPEAHRVAEIFGQTDLQFLRELHKITDNESHPHVRMVALEGLVNTALPLAHGLLQTDRVAIVTLDVFDLSELEEAYLKGAYDLAFSCREPGNKTLRYKAVLGYQSLAAVEKPSKQAVVIRSSFENAILSGSKSPEKVFVSNALHVRQSWLDVHGGTATIPSSLSRKKSGAASEVPVLCLGSDVLPKRLWEICRAQLSPGLAS